ncbi:MAG TPA: PEP-CTERM sorting domain-containing protein [Phenylobacterium sp.]|jgi:hypothetical protein|nr:PEP-CTERM sorting domain-containing protein [Phenylobacterium sp.]
MSTQVPLNPDPEPGPQPANRSVRPPGRRLKWAASSALAILVLTPGVLLGAPLGRAALGWISTQATDLPAANLFADEDGTDGARRLKDSLGLRRGRTPVLAARPVARSSASVSDATAPVVPKIPLFQLTADEQDPNQALGLDSVALDPLASSKGGSSVATQDDEGSGGRGGGGGFAGGGMGGGGGSGASGDGSILGAMSNGLTGGLSAGDAASGAADPNGQGSVLGLTPPDGAALSASPIPEPRAWSLLIAGLGLAGAALRRTRRRGQEAMALRARSNALSAI